MRSKLKPYPQYRRANLPWLERVPSHWQTVRAKSIFRKMQRPVRPEDEVVTCFRDGAVTLRKNRRTTGFTESMQEIGYQGIREGDLVIHAMDAFAGAIGASDSNGKGTPVYAVCQPSALANATYFAILLREMSMSEFLLSLARGIRERSTDFRYADFAVLQVPLPPREEQEQIVRFIRHLDQRVNQLVKAKKRLAELLNEQKQAIIHQAVTTGLDPGARLKPSGIDWLGSIPSHWRTAQIKRLLTRMDYGTSESSKDDGLIRVLTMAHIREGEVLVPTSGGVDALPEDLLLEENDLLFNRTNSPELVGKVGMFKGSVGDRVSFASYLVRLRPKQRHNPAWLNYVLNSSQFWSSARSQALVSLHQANLNSTRYGQMQVPVPPRKEQNAITAHLLDRLSNLEGVLTKTRSEIDIFREYRTRLVGEIVTGQLDVRHLDLPEVEDSLIESIESAAEEEPEEPEQPEEVEA